jgi:hypothetical protein
MRTIWVLAVLCGSMVIALLGGGSFGQISDAANASFGQISGAANTARAYVGGTATVVRAYVGQISGQTSDAATAYPCNNRSYLNSSGHVVHSPSCGSGSEPPHHTATCRDGSVSYSEHHRGTCSYHGGVARWD